MHGVDHRGQLLFGNSPCEAGSMGMSHVQTMLHQPVSEVETLCQPYVEGTSERIVSERGRISKIRARYAMRNRAAQLRGSTPTDGADIRSMTKCSLVCRSQVPPLPFT